MATIHHCLDLVQWHHTANTLCPHHPTTSLYLITANLFA